jgi:hypothetical protein
MKEFLHRILGKVWLWAKQDLSHIGIVAVVLMLLLAYGAGFINKHFFSDKKSDKSGSVVLSDKTVNDLVDKAANQKYLQKVFDAPESFKKLPMPKATTEFQPLPEGMGDKSSKGAVAQRCTYKGQSYVVGDIVKTDQEWVKCTPSIVFVDSEDKDKGKVTTKQVGSPVWTLVQ